MAPPDHDQKARRVDPVSLRSEEPAEQDRRSRREQTSECGNCRVAADGCQGLGGRGCGCPPFRTPSPWIRASRPQNHGPVTMSSKRRSLPGPRGISSCEQCIFGACSCSGRPFARGLGCSQGRRTSISRSSPQPSGCGVTRSEVQRGNNLRVRTRFRSTTIRTISGRLDLANAAESSFTKGRSSVAVPL